MNFKKFKQEKKFTMQQLSILTGLSKRTLEDIQRRGDCLVSNAIKIAEALNVTLDELCKVDKGE